MKATLLAFFIVCLLPLDALPNAKDEVPWTGKIPNFANEPERWKDLVDDLYKKGYYYGVIDASERMLKFFEDKETLEYLYAKIIDTVDKGYVHSTVHLFGPSQIELEDPYRSQTYYIYKALINYDRGTDKWAEAYLKNVDKEKFPKFRFSRALAAYSEDDVEDAFKKYQEVLSSVDADTPRPLIVKSIRNLARIHFEKREFEKAKDIYESVLLRLNPIQPSDWLEAAWTRYRLGEYPEVLGHLYNLESESGKGTIHLDKYIMRALSYVSTCDIENVKKVHASFEKDLGGVVRAIKQGRAITRHPVWKNIYNPEALKYREKHQILDRLVSERKQIKALKRSNRALASYLYDSAIARTQVEARYFQEQAVESTAREVIYLSESLRFLGFQAQRERYSPLKVFNLDDKAPTIEEVEGQLKIRWPQFGDYWRDERLLLKGKLVDQC